MTKASTANSLILLSFICFGIFGSLSHLFNLILVLFLTWNYFNSKNELLIEPAAKKLYLALCSVFFAFLIRGLFHSDLWISIQSLSPMMSMPIIGMMILLTQNDSFHISAKQIANYAKISIAITFIVYITFSQSLAFLFDLREEFVFGRIEIFSGNSIPFSMAVFGISVFCFTHWQYSKKSEKLTIIACMLAGFWMAGIESGTRGTLLTIIIAMPILILYVYRSLSLILLVFILTSLILWLSYTGKISILDINYTDRLVNGIDTLLGRKITDSSITVRLELWSSSVSAIRENLFWGYDNSNRFTALLTHLPEELKGEFSHPHNDILASTISAGLIGGILAIFSFLSPVLAGLLSKENTREKVFLGSLLSMSILITANVNTVFFNDITAAWLAFSTFLIWKLNYN